jgi:hypothetical protein
VGEVLRLATKTLYAEGERRKRDAARQERADQQRERRRRDDETDLYQACCQVMDEAVDKLTSGGQYPRYSAHTLFYNVRPRIQPYTSRELKSHYFEQTLLPRYQREVKRLPGLYYEPRGVLYEPHTGVAVPLGTREVEEYHFPLWLYNKILFVEKKGLWPVFQDARLAERYDMAIIAGEGFASVACRVLFAHADKEQKYQVLVLHDADPWGYNIERTSREETQRMPGHQVDVIDIGLRLADALEMGLLAEDFTRRKGLPSGLHLTEQEQEYFVGRQVAWGKMPQWACKRVEVNAFDNAGLVAYTERSLQAAGVRPKVIPSQAELPALAEGLYQEVARAAGMDELARLVGGNAFAAKVAAELRRRVPLSRAGKWIKEAFAIDPYTSWRAALADRVREALQRSDVAEVVRRLALEALQGNEES